LQIKWTGAKATGKAQAGRRFTIFDEHISGRYLDLQPERHILEEWQTAQWPANAPPSIVEITLEEAGEETQVIVVQSMIPPGHAKSIRQEWTDRYWNPLRAFLARQNGT